MRTGLTLLLIAHSFQTAAQPGRAAQAAAGARAAVVAAGRLGIREATGKNDGPAIDAMLRLVGSPRFSPWCGAEQAWQQQLCGLPFPRQAGGARFWAVDPVRTYFVRGTRGSVDSLKPGHQVMFYYANLGRIGHIGRAVAPGRSVRRGRPARGWWCVEGNTGTSGTREGAGVHRLFRQANEFYACTNYLY